MAERQTLAAAVERMRPRTRTWGMLPDLSYGVRGGRVAKSKKMLADLLNLTPVLTATPEGFVKPGGVLFGRSNTTVKFARFVARRLATDRTWRLLIGHCNAPAEGERLLGLLRTAVPRVESAQLVDVGPALGAHAGPGALVVGAQDYEAPTR